MKKKESLFNKNYLLLSLVNLVTALGFSMITSIISPYAVSIGAGLTLAGFLTGVFSISALFVRPFTGAALDILNKRNMCIFSTAMICVSFLGYGLVQSIPMLLFFRVLHGMSFGVSSTSVMALVCEYIPKERLGEGLGYFGLGQVVSRIIGPYIGIELKDKIGYQSLFVLIALTTGLAILILLTIKVEKKEYKSIKEIGSSIQLSNLIEKDCIVYALIAGLFSLANGVTASFMVLLGEERVINNIALFFSVNAIALAVLRLVVGKFIDREKLMPIVIMSLIVSGVSMVMVGNASGLTAILIAAVLKAIGQGTGQLSLQSACIKKVDATRVGVATSTYYIGADIGQGLGPIIGGKVSELYSYKTMFYFVAILMVVGIIVFIPYQIRESRR